jgi:excisionase family DNA binding protein
MTKPQTSNFPAAVGQKTKAFEWQAVPHHQVKIAAQILGVSVALVYAKLHEGELRAVKLAGRTLVTTESLLAFLATAEPWTPDPAKSERFRALRKGTYAPKSSAA